MFYSYLAKYMLRLGKEWKYCHIFFFAPPALHLLLIYYKENEGDKKNKIQTRCLDSQIGSN